MIEKFVAMDTVFCFVSAFFIVVVSFDDVTVDVSVAQLIAAAVAA